MSLRSPRSPSRRSGIISPPPPPSSPPPMPMYASSHVSSSAIPRRPKVSSPMPLPPLPIPDSVDFCTPGPSRYNTMSPGAKSGAEDADGRERRMKRRSRRDLAVQPEMLLPLEGRHDGHDLSDVLSRNDTACGVPIRVAAPYRSPGVPKQGVQGGMLPSLPKNPETLITALDFSSPEPTSTSWTPRRPPCTPHLDVHYDPLNSVSQSSTESALQAQMPTPIVKIHPSPSSPRISAMLLDTPPLPSAPPSRSHSSTPRSRRASGLAAIRASIPPQISSMEYPEPSVEVPPLPYSPATRSSKTVAGSGPSSHEPSLLQPAYDVTSPRPTRSGYDVTSPRPRRLPAPSPTQSASPAAATGSAASATVVIDFGASSFTPAAVPCKEQSAWEPDRPAALLPPLPLKPLDLPGLAGTLTASISPGAHVGSPDTIRIQLNTPTQAMSTPTPPRPARRRYDNRTPTQASTCHTPSQMQPSPLALPSPLAADEMPVRRNSTQRRLTALRGLVEHIDFGQPWSTPDTVGPQREPLEGHLDENRDPMKPAIDFMGRDAGHITEKPWVGKDNAGLVQERMKIAVSHVPRQAVGRKGSSGLVVGSKVKLRATSPGRPLAAVSQDHGWPSPSTTPIRAVRDTPPRPRQRTEVFNVASAGYNSSAPATPLTQPHSDMRSRRHDHIVPSNGGSCATSTPTPATWRSTLSSDLIYTRLYAVDPDRVTRQEIMWEMCETEQIFLRSIRTVLRLFAIPVKTPQGKWIDGIPPPISELFDNLESIAHVHSVLCASQRDMQRRAEVLDFDSFVILLKNWTPRLTGAYEWYLCKFEAVVALVEDHVRDSDSVFGEFVRMQLQDEALGSMSLGSMLLKPVQRLMKYPLFFKRLQEVTPRHPELLALIGSTESIIHSLQATKAREDEYRQLKILESRLSWPVDMDPSAYSSTSLGPTGSFRLPTRDRKLLGMSTVHRLTPSQMNLPVRSSIASSTSSAGTTASCYFSQGSGQTPSRQSSFSASSVSSGPSRSGSLRMSMSMSMGMGISLPMSPGGAKDRLYRTPSMSSMNASSDHSPRTPRSRRSKEELTLFVFDDLVILAQSQEKGGLFTSKTKKERGWRVLPEAEGGLGRVVGVREWEGPVPCFLLTILPLNASLPCISLCLSIPIPREPASPSLTSATSTKRNALLPDVKIFSTMQQLMQTLQDTQTVCEDELEGKEELASVLLDSEDMAGGSRIGEHEVSGGGVEVVYTAGIGEDHPLFSLQALGY